jgi:hypothetical protein
MFSTGSAISEVSLSTKERNALQLLEVSTVDEFLQIDLRHVFGLRGFGATTYAKLKRSRDTVRAMLFPEDSDGNGTCQLRNNDEDIGALAPTSSCSASAIFPESWIDEDIRGLGLTSRGLKALRRLKVKAVREFLLLDLTGLSRLQNCGAVTREHLIQVQADLRRRFGPGFPKGATETLQATAEPRQDEAMREFVKQQATPCSWRKLPLFSGRPLRGIRPADLHESYHPGIPVERLMMTGRVRRAIAGKGITSLGEMLLMPGLELIGHDHLGNGTLASVQSLIDAFLKHSMNGSPRLEIDTGSPDGFLTSLLKPVIGNERQRRILLERMGWRSDPRTLNDVAQQFGLTRERIRQIEKAGLKQLLHWQAAEALGPLHDLISGMLRDLTPVMSLRGICKALQVLYGWSRPIHKEAITRFLPAFSDLKCVERCYVCLRCFRCIECPSLPKALDAALVDTPEKKISLSPLARRLRAQMLRAEDCQHCGECPAKASVNLVRIALARSAIASKQFRVVKSELWARDHWRISKGPISAVLESILKSRPGPMSYHEVHAAINRTRQDKVSPEIVWHALSASANHGTDILLWGRGGPYQHKSHVNLYAPILNTIEKWVIQALYAGPFPQLSANAAFQAFMQECVAAGLTSEYAIHSCLKHRQHPKLLFFKTPYISLAGALGYRTPNLEIVEELVRQEGDVVEYEELRKTACERMGLKDFQFLQITNQWENVIRTDKGFLHVDYFDATSPAFAALVEYVKQRLAREGQISADLIYGEKRVSCLQLRIDGPRMLYSVLARFAGEFIAARMYPLLTLASREDATANDSIRSRIVAYVRDKRQPVSCEELRRRFVAKLGFSYQSVMAAASTDSILHYLNGILVHVDTIAWDADKQSQLLDVAERYYTDQLRAGDVFARADLLLELHESDLPALAHGIDWTPILVAELLERDKRVRVFGNRRNAFLFNSDERKLASFADFVALLLEKHFQGAASLTELSAFLREARVIAKAVTPRMLEGADSLLVGEREIAVKGAC